MIYINEKRHISTIISSLNKDYKRSKKYGELNPLEIYYIDMIYNLIYNCGLNINDKDINSLISLYNKISYKSENICQNKELKPFHLNVKPTFIQPESSDCGSIPNDIKNKIYFWQQNSLTDRIAEVKLLITESFLSTKYYHSPEAFEQGRDLAYDSIGVICFLDDNSTTTNYEIKDQLGNIVTDAFRFYNSLAKRQTLIVSKNIYSFGEMFFKIKKL